MNKNTILKLLQEYENLPVILPIKKYLNAYEYIMLRTKKDEFL